MLTLQVNAQGQLTIPPEIAAQLGLLPGSEVQLQITGDSLEIRKKPTQTKGQTLIATLRGKATTSLSTNNILEISRG